MKTESSTNSPTATLAPTKSQRDPVGLQATSTPSHLTGDLRTNFPRCGYETLDYKSFSKFRLRKWRVRNWLGSPVGSTTAP